MIAVRANYFAPVFGFGTLLREVSSLLAVAAYDSGRVARLLAVFCYVPRFEAILALLVRALFGEMAHCQCQ